MVYAILYAGQIKTILYKLYSIIYYLLKQKWDLSPIFSNLYSLFFMLYALNLNSLLSTL